tara:strand:- start:3278 stop:4153 length:876 start_codon:yes stop_codon:yes gene_type:complete
MDGFILIILILVAAFFYFNYKDKEEPTQEEIQTLEYVEENKPETIIIKQKDFPYPQISHGFKKLGKEAIHKPLNNLKELLPGGSNDITVVRDKPGTMTKKRVYFPDYYRKDRLGGNDIGNSEVRPFVRDSEKPEDSWTDNNVSEHPKFYNSDIQNELTNVGMFFDKNNQYNDKTSPNTNVLVSDGCYESKYGEKFCEDNTRLQNIPPSLITDVNKCYTLNSIGIYKDKINKPKDYTSFDVETIDEEQIGVWSYGDDRTINGGKFYNEVYGSKDKNEDLSAPLKPLRGDCSF